MPAAEEAEAESSDEGGAGFEEAIVVEDGQQDIAMMTAAGTDELLVGPGVGQEPGEGAVLAVEEHTLAAEHKGV